MGVFNPIAGKFSIPGMLLAGLLATPANADVLQDRNGGPFAGLFGLPDSTEGGRILENGTHGWGLSVLHASHSVNDVGIAESINLDGESSRVELGYNIGVSDKFEVGIRIPYVKHRAGGLDSFIDSWHNLFGLPNGPRSIQPQDILAFQYADSFGNALSFTNGTQGLGDVRLIGGWQLKRTDIQDVALRFGVKFASGDSDELLGSGGIDANLGVAGDVRNLFGVESLSGFYRAHIVYLGNSDIIAGRNERLADFVSFGLGWQVNKRFDLRVQGATHAALFDSELDTLGDRSAILTVGGNIRIADEYELSIGVSEDIAVATAPDVAFQLVFRYLGQQ